jgi:hypothetical protein
MSIHNLIINRDLENLKLLLKKGSCIDINQPDMFGNTALIYAATSGGKTGDKIFKLILSHQPNINILDPSGNSVVHIIIFHLQGNKLHLLLKKYSHALLILNKQGETAYNFCKLHCKNQKYSKIKKIISGFLASTNFLPLSNNEIAVTLSSKSESSEYITETDTIFQTNVAKESDYASRQYCYSHRIQSLSEQIDELLFFNGLTKYSPAIVFNHNTTENNFISLDPIILGKQYISGKIESSIYNPIVEPSYITNIAAGMSVTKHPGAILEYINTHKSKQTPICYLSCIYFIKELIRFDIHAQYITTKEFIIEFNKFFNRNNKNFKLIKNILINVMSKISELFKLRCQSSKKINLYANLKLSKFKKLTALDEKISYSSIMQNYSHAAHAEKSLFINRALLLAEDIFLLTSISFISLINPIYESCDLIAESQNLLINMIRHDILSCNEKHVKAQWIVFYLTIAEYLLHNKTDLHSFSIIIIALLHKHIHIKSEVFQGFKNLISPLGNFKDIRNYYMQNPCNTMMYQVISKDLIATKESSYNLTQKALYNSLHINDLFRIKNNLYSLLFDNKIKQGVLTFKTTLPLRLLDIKKQLTDESEYTYNQHLDELYISRNSIDLSGRIFDKPAYAKQESYNPENNGFLIAYDTFKSLFPEKACKEIANKYCELTVQCKI